MQRTKTISLNKDDVFIQSPIFDLNYLEFFDLKITPNNQNWEKYIEDVLLNKFSYFRISYISKNKEFTSYFLNLLEGFFL